MRTLFPTLLLAALATAPLPAAEPARPLVKLELGEAKIEGTTLATWGNQVLLLSRDGRLWDFDSRQAADIQKTTLSFHAYAAGTMRGRLQMEFGRGFEVSGTGHYLVVHPTGQKDQWNQRFEELYRSFVHYFSVRGLKVGEPEFPLVAVVLPTHKDFVHYAAREGTSLADGTLGYYLPVSNRIALYDVTEGRDDIDWSHNAATIIHEATHQTAFNCGVHNRFSPPPRWTAEGLGTLFEAAGVWDSRRHPRKADRINRGRLEDFRARQSARQPGVLVDLISSDRLFDTDPMTAYAEAWAFTWFLVETRPRDYAKYLARTASRPAFQAPTSAERLADFTAIFGDNLRLLDASFLRFMADAR